MLEIKTNSPLLTTYLSIMIHLDIEQRENLKKHLIQLSKPGNGMNYGLYPESEDGKSWSDPQIGYKPLENYINQPPAPKHLNRYGRLERPQLLFQDGKPTYLFTASQGGAYETASSFIFKIKPN